ncbi:MAG: glucan ABC transporter ATP-binding protein/ permease [Notoacmeibacter sp.]|nr:glucan ABC transporter ATP-binding protein/ permease [Notoacmeibacter sp.]MCC0033108.1 glucan ABC transporter ATP-binding protein/ permease [Brucellaceae bacterium]
MAQAGAGALYWRSLVLLGPERWRALALALAGAVIAVVQLAEPVLFGRMIDRLAAGAGAFRLIALWAGLGLFSIAASAVLAVMSDRLAHRARLAALSDAYSRAITLPVAWHAEKGSGQVVRTILSGTDTLFGLWLAVLREQLTMLVSIALMVPAVLAINWRMALVLIALGASYLVLNALVIARTRAGQAAVESHSGKVFGRVGDVIPNVTVVQSYGRFAEEMRAMRAMTGDLLSAQYPVLTWWGLLSVLTRAAATISMVAIFALGAVLVGRGDATVGEIVSFGAFAGLLIGHLDRLSSFVSGMHRRVPALSSFFELADAAGDSPDRADAKVFAGRARGEVRYRDVTYRFGDSESGVHGICFAVGPGRTVALVGPTGSGKTTTLALLQRLRSPQSGTIELDGKDIAGLTLESLRSQIAVVFQEAGLFNRSIADNIRIGKPTVTEAEVVAAARAAEAHDFIMAKPGGYGFVIGERGNALSGGERQRIAIARAILKDAPVLILDEATSALDPLTESRIARAIERLRAGRTTLVIAHRLSTVAHADEILVLDKGRIVERGTFASLEAEGGLFAAMVREGAIVRPEDSPSPDA